MKTNIKCGACNGCSKREVMKCHKTCNEFNTYLNQRKMRYKSKIK